MARHEHPASIFVGARLLPVAALVMVAALAVLGHLSLLFFNASLEPELATRSRLVGTIVREDVQRALDAGVPLRRVAGVESYVSGVLAAFPEVRSIQLLDTHGGRIFGVERPSAAGTGASFGLPAPGLGRFSHRSVILSGNAVAGEVIVEVDEAFVREQFADVLLDLGVLVLVILLLMFEVLRAMLWLQVTRPLRMVMALAAQQARGVFSGTVALARDLPLGRIGARLSFQAEDLHERFVRRQASGRQVSPGRLDSLGRRLGIAGPPRPIGLASGGDMRLPLFLFAIGEELSKSFLPVLVRQSLDGVEWLDPGLLVSLPFAAYLFALMIVSPIAGPIAERFGPRAVFLAAAVPVAASHVGLGLASSLGEFVAWRGLSGIGYALATIACQEYALRKTPRRWRSNAMSGFVAAVFGGTFCGTAVGGVLADRLGTGATFMIGAALVALSALAAFGMMSAERDQAEREPATPAPGGLARVLLNARFLAVVLGIALPLNVLMVSCLWYIVPLALDGMGLRAADIGRALMLYYLLTILVAPLAANIADRWSMPAAVAVVGGGVSALGMLALALWYGVMPIVWAIVAAGIGHGAVRATLVSVALDATGAEAGTAGAATTLAVLRALERGGSILGLLATALFVGQAGYQDAAVAAGWLALAGVAGFALAHGLRRRG